MTLELFLYFELLPKLGCNLAEQKRVFSQVLPLFKKSQLIILIGSNVAVELANWLRASEVYFCLRLKRMKILKWKLEIGSP